MATWVFIVARVTPRTAPTEQKPRALHRGLLAWMARKARESQSVAAESWATPNYWLASAGHATPKATNIFGGNAVRGAAVVLHLPEDDAPPHPFLSLAPAAQQLMLLAPDGDSPPAIVFMDLAPLMAESIGVQQNMQTLKSSLGASTAAAATAALDAEAASATVLGKQLGKPASRALCKLLGSGMHDVTLVACGGAAQLALKLLGSGSDERALRVINRIVLVHPRLTPQCVNAQLGRGAAQRYASLSGVPLDVVFESSSAAERRLPALRHLFHAGTDRVATGSNAALLVHALRQAASGEGAVVLPSLPPFDSDSMDMGGRGLWLSELGFAISRDTKQHEARIIDAAHVHAEAEAKAAVAASRGGRAVQWHVATPDEPVPVADAAGGASAGTAAAGNEAGNGRPGGGGGDDSAAAAGSAAVREEVGALVLRGNRCVLVRSLSKPAAWAGMRIPSVTPQAGEAQAATAIRAASELCDIDINTELLPLPAVPPALLYRPGGVRVWVYACYAARGPPPGPLEDADESDEDDLYDWYTWPRAMAALASDSASIAALRTMACALAAAAAAGELASKWGGVFGQEFTGGWGATQPAAAMSTSAGGREAVPHLQARAEIRPMKERFAELLEAMSLAEVLECSAAAASAAAMRFTKGGPSPSSTITSGDGRAAGQPVAAEEAELKFCALRPFHPLRLHAALLAIAEDEGNGAGTSKVRIDGLGWLASQPGLQALVRSHPASGAIEVDPGDPWWASVPRERWPRGLAEDIGPMWHEPTGDRQIDLTLSEGTHEARLQIRSRLEQCLATDAEAALGPNALEDPYAEEWRRVLDEEAAQQRADVMGDAMRKAAQAKGQRKSEAVAAPEPACEPCE